MTQFMGILCEFLWMIKYFKLVAFCTLLPISMFCTLFLRYLRVKKNAIGKLGHRKHRLVKFCKKNRSRTGGNFEGTAELGLKVTIVRF